MSHYIDIRGGAQYVVDKGISDDAYYSAWITDDDRDAYERYLNGTKHAARALETSKFVCSLFDLLDGIKTTVDLGKIKNTRVMMGHIGNVVGEKETVKNIVEQVITKKKLFTDTEDPKEFVDHLRNTLKDENYDELASDSAKSVICAIVVGIGNGGVGGFLKGVALTTYGVHSYAIKDIFDRVWWLSLLYTNSLRVSSRAMRYYGLQ